MQHVFSAVPIIGGRKGILKKDKDGYYDFLVGALGTANTSGVHYSLEKSVDAFSASSSLQRKIAKGALYSEHNHPQMPPGGNMSDYIRRLLRIEPKNISSHFSEITLDDEVYKLDNNPLKKGEVGIRAKIKPAGRYGPSLEESLNNPKENVAYSIRSLTSTDTSGPVPIKAVKTAITFDTVVIGGMATASKYAAPGLEAEVEEITDEVMMEIETQLKQEADLGLEDDSMVYDILEEIRSSHVSVAEAIDIYQDVPLSFKDYGLEEDTSTKSKFIF